MLCCVLPFSAFLWFSVVERRSDADEANFVLHSWEPLMDARTYTSDFHILAACGLRGIILKLVYISLSSAFQRVKVIGKRMLNMGHRS